MRVGKYITVLAVLAILSIPAEATYLDIFNTQGTYIYQNQYLIVERVEVVGGYYLIIRDQTQQMNIGIVPMVVFTTAPKFYKSGDVFVIEGKGNIVADMIDRVPISTGKIKFEITNQYIKYTTECTPYNGMGYLIAVPQQTATITTWDGNLEKRWTASSVKTIKVTAPVGITVTGNKGATAGVAHSSEFGEVTISVDGWPYGWFISGSDVVQTEKAITGWFVVDKTKADPTYTKSLYEKVTQPATPVPEGYVNINQIMGYTAGALGMLAAALYFIRRT